MPKKPRTASKDHRRTVKLSLIEQHYANFDEELEWTVDRFRRLCAALRLTPYELGALVRMRVHQTETCLETNCFPAPVELHLTIFERAIFPNSHPPIIPAL